MEPEKARKFFKHINRGMRETLFYNGHSYPQAISEQINSDDHRPTVRDTFGDSGLFIFGVCKGMELIKTDSTIEVDRRQAGTTKTTVSNDRWQEHYEEYGSGAYGRGLVLGKRLAYFENRDFEFVDNTERFEFTEDTEENQFTFTE